jgi:hypothetical protein
MTEQEYIEHLEHTILRLKRRVSDLEQKQSDYMWERYPDTSGGPFTQEEINRSKEW